MWECTYIHVGVEMHAYMHVKVFGYRECTRVCVCVADGVAAEKTIILLLSCILVLWLIFSCRAEEMVVAVARALFLQSSILTWLHECVPCSFWDLLNVRRL